MRLECHNLSFSYPGTEIIVLDKMNCAFIRPGFHSIFGPSGVGKSSFAKLIGVKADHPPEITTEAVDTILYSYNMERLPGWASAGSHLEKIVPRGKSALKQQLIEAFELTPLLQSRFHQLSMGQQNRVNLIRYLLQDFDLLILDESLANVDEKLREHIILTIKELFPDKMFLYISHNLMEVSTFCDQIMVFGSSNQTKSYQMIEGQNCLVKTAIDQGGRDQTMLKIMNAF